MKTTADITPQAAASYGKLERPSAVASATGDGYTKTKAMQKAQASKGQFGLPQSPGRKKPSITSRM